MDGMLQETDVNQISRLLQEHNGQDVCVLDLRGMNNWTDFFIIATVTSKTHMDGIEKYVKEFCRENEIEIYRSSGRRNSHRNAKRHGNPSASPLDDEWRLIDLGSAIIHLMNKRVRDFYELERLWMPIPQSAKREVPA